MRAGGTRGDWSGRWWEGGGGGGAGSNCGFRGRFTASVKSSFLNHNCSETVMLTKQFYERRAQ